MLITTLDSVAGEGQVRSGVQAVRTIQRNRRIVVPRYGGPDVMTIVEEAIPEPRPQKVRVMLWALSIAALLVAAPLHAAPAASSDKPLRLQIIGTGGTIEGTCFLLHKTSADSGVALYFLTASALFDLAVLGERQVAPLRIVVTAAPHDVIETRGSTVVFPAGLQRGLALAVIKATVPKSDWRPVRASLGDVYPGDAFVLRGQRGEQGAVLEEHVRFRSTRLVSGDSSAADMNGFVGAPAIGSAGVFGIVTECSATRAPVITLLSAATGFLTRAVPGWPAVSLK